MTRSHSLSVRAMKRAERMASNGLNMTPPIPTEYGDQEVSSSQSQPSGDGERPAPPTSEPAGPRVNGKLPKNWKTTATPIQRVAALLDFMDAGGARALCDPADLRDLLPTPRATWGARRYEVDYCREGPGATPRWCLGLNGVGHIPIGWFYRKADAEQAAVALDALRAPAASPRSAGVSQDEPKPLDREAVARIIGHSGSEPSAGERFFRAVRAHVIPTLADWPEQPPEWRERYEKAALSFEAEVGWRAIETAPRDGTRIRALQANGDQDEVQWEEYRACMLGARAGSYGPGWQCTHNNLPACADPGFEPTHWQPLPEAPR